MQVYLAHEDRPQGGGREVVLKIVQRASPEDVEHIHQLRRQAPTLCNLQHPCIVRTLEFFEHLDSLVLVLEAIDGVSLAELLEIQKGSGKAKLSDAAVFHIAASVLEALAYAHGVSDASGAATPVVHKAVSPANVLVARDGTVKLGGFGFVKPFGISTDVHGRLKCESPCMAPEQIDGRSPTPKADVYAAGLVLWELLSGRPARVLPRNPLSALALNVMTKRPDPIATVRPDLAPELTAMLDAALASAPEERTMTCAEMAQCIRKLAPGASGKEDLRAVMRAVPSVSLGPPRSATKLVPRPTSRDEAKPSAARLKASPQGEGASKPVAPEPAVLIMPIVDLSGPAVSDEPAQRTSTESPVSAAEPTEDSSVSRETSAEDLLPEDLIETGDWVDEPAVLVHTSGIRRISLIDRMKKPTRWHRRTLLGIWMGLLVLLVPLIVVLRNRAPRSVQTAFAAPKEATMTGETAPSEAPSAPGPAAAPAVVAGMRPEEPSANAAATPEANAAATPEANAAATPEANAAATPEANPPPPQQNAAEDPPLPSGFGRLTVHSSVPSAMVYGKRTVYGSVEEPLVVPCGQQFFRIGVPGLKGKRIAWQGRGKMIPIACGQAVEITMGGAQAPH